MNDKEPLIPQSTETWTLDELFERSLDAFRGRLGLPSKPIVEADQPTFGQSLIDSTKEELAKVNQTAQEDHIPDTGDMIKDAKETGDTTE